MNSCCTICLFWLIQFIAVAGTMMVATYPCGDIRNAFGSSPKLIIFKLWFLRPQFSVRVLPVDCIAPSVAAGLCLL